MKIIIKNGVFEGYKTYPAGQCPIVKVDEKFIQIGATANVIATFKHGDPCIIVQDCFCGQWTTTLHRPKQTVFSSKEA